MSPGGSWLVAPRLETGSCNQTTRISDQPRVIAAGGHEDRRYNRPPPTTSTVKPLRAPGIMAAFRANQAWRPGHVVPALRASRPSSAAILKQPHVQQHHREAGRDSNGCPDDRNGQPHECIMRPGGRYPQYSRCRRGPGSAMLNATRQPLLASPAVYPPGPPPREPRPRA